MSRIAKILVCLMLCLAMISGICVALAEQPVTIRFSWWGGDSRHEATLKAIELYMQKNPHVTIEAEYSGFSGYYQKLVTQLSSGNAPDVFQSDQGWTAELHARGGVFANLKDFADIDTSTFAEQMLNDYCVKDDQLVVLPLGYNGTVFLYNKDLLKDYLDENGGFRVTWDQFIEAGKALREKDSSVYLMTGITDGYVRFILKPMIEQLTGEISVKDDFTLGFTVEQMTQAFEAFAQVFESGSAQPYAESVIYDSYQNNPLWIEGKIGGIFLFFSNVDTEISGIPYAFDVDALPQFDGALTSGQESAPSLMIAVNSGSKVQEESAKFANWLLNDPEAALILATQRGVPASSVALKALNDNAVLSPLMAKGVQVSDETVGFKNGAYEMDSSVHAIFVEKMEKVIYKAATPAQAAQELYDELTARLAEIKGGE